MSAPPPPPPHGEAPKTTGGSGGSGLPPGNYDIFVIPEHSAGSGFIYLPSMRPNINSFVAGFASALAIVALGNSMAPAFRAWWANFQGMGNVGLAMLVIAVGLGAWSLGRIQHDGPQSNEGTGSNQGSSRSGSPGSGPSSPGQGAGAGTNGGAHHQSGHQSGHGSAGGGHHGYNSAPPPQQSSPPPPPPQESESEQPKQAPPPPTQDPPPTQPPPQPGQQQQQQQSGSEQPKPTWQQSQQQNYQRQAPRPKAQPSTPGAESAKNAWQKAREETRRKEEERKAQEAEKKRREETAARLRVIREREAREREARDRREREDKDKRERELRETREREMRERTERENREKELKAQREQLEKELRAKIEQEGRDKEQREKAEQERHANDIREQIERAARELAEKEKARKAKEDEERQKELDRINRKGSSYAFSAVGERTNPWPNGKPPVPPSVAPSSSPAGAQAPRSAPPPTTGGQSSYGGASPRKPGPAPSSAGPSKKARVQDEEETYSYRPYDKPKRPQPVRKKSISDLSESSWAPSHSTAHTSPPPSMRQPYTTNDPDKIVIRAVYGFLNQFAKTPSSQLLSGVGSVTDGLILRITTEGLFIDDDVRGVPQREWDVKAWTLKLVEVWCPAHAVALANSAANDHINSVKPSAANVNNATFLPRAAWRKAFSGAGGVRGEPRPLTDEQADAYLADMLRECKALCGLGLCETVHPSAFDDSVSASASSASSHSAARTKFEQNGEFKTKGLHLVRATVRDQEGKRFLFVLDQEEAWKVSKGLQRLRQGTQVRSLGVASLSNSDVRTTLAMLGWA
ncbi:hypothetical protein SPBR_00241 [Sporothrix brasiliensis 5110]|uniref:Trans-sialidase-like protein n=1 Tax=Sporothrix brasiliensis 5110 TaxID=1398154 RepID=A0A0C2EVA1_9PEZI|nr:uncharacterized protein SPBR_00241 [Sporothrix brasiliensis 5110]KIH90514.1 hypothetical protein SPBR_00241 [Sporothrix brasiliensis 5110]